jgi:excisionase family DNA binding protein
MFDDEMLTIDDLAAYLKLKPQTIYKWAQAGKLPGAKFGKEWRFRRSSIERWIDSYIPSETEPRSRKSVETIRKRRTGPASAAKIVKKPRS